MTRLRILLAAACAVNALALVAPTVPRRPRAPAVAATRRGRDGKIYVGENDPLEDLAELLGGLARGADRAVESLLGGPQPILQPIPVTLPRGDEDSGPREP